MRFKKKLAIVLCTTINQMFAVGNVLIGLKKHFSLPEDEYDIILYVNKKLDKKDENAIKSIYKDAIINIYKSPFPKSFKNTNCALQWSIMAFARYECFSLIEKYNNVLYLDTDILIQKDIIDLLNIKENIGVCFEDVNTIRENIESMAQKFNSSKYNLDKKLFNSGVFIINDSITNGNEIKDWCYKMSVKWLTADQPILNLAVQEFNINVYGFSDAYNRYKLSKKGLKDACIIHALCGVKFWNTNDSAEWNENNQKWIELGGAVYDPKYVENKMKEINKIAWWIPNKKLRDIYRVRMGEKYGFRWELY
ncbi:glycosyltransferase [Brachyspira sp.]|uniref:glycosyltransferase n=1 Tax=Brachyspira sp. TaxID=1977261 RepID=UPI003D7E7A04